MEIKVIRKEFLQDRCLGELYIDGKYFCNTLEDTDRGLNKDMSNKEIDDIKVVGSTATPAGKYRLILSYSIKLKRFLPLLLDVPRGKGVRIHKGSSPAYTSACILVGFGISKKKTLTGIKQAEEALIKLLKIANLTEPLYITIQRDK